MHSSILSYFFFSYETINVHLKRKPDWLLARNPKGRVPVLEFSDGRIVFESVITCQYLDDVYPQEPLTPADPYQKARDRLFVDYCDKVCWPYNVVFENIHIIYLSTII